jgi:alpha-tubulin suppressor-like RCC1 family protein
LGTGFITTYVSEPYLIKDLSSKNITFLACGDDYSAALSIFGEVFVTGSMENGKLGVGQSWKQGLLLNFTNIPKLSAIKYVACGPNHMVAISDLASNETGGTGG